VVQDLSHEIFRRSKWIGWLLWRRRTKSPNCSILHWHFSSPSRINVLFETSCLRS
jgi:hypothetical protein